MLFRSLFVLAALSISLSTAQAQFPCATPGAGFAGWSNPYSYYVGSDRPPFYAMFPPVYYSYPVPRTYGYSPFAYPAGTMTPEIEISEPETIVNPYIKPKAAEPTKAPDEKKAEPLPKPATKTSSMKTAEDRVQVIANPYFDQPVAPVRNASKSY
jgi:hypothetical protein